MQHITCSHNWTTNNEVFFPSTKFQREPLAIRKIYLPIQVQHNVVGVGYLFLYTRMGSSVDYSRQETVTHKKPDNTRGCFTHTVDRSSLVVADTYPHEAARHQVFEEGQMNPLLNLEPRDADLAQLLLARNLLEPLWRCAAEEKATFLFRFSIHSFLFRFFVCSLLFRFSVYSFLFRFSVYSFWFRFFFYLALVQSNLGPVPGSIVVWCRNNGI